ncbi:MAG: hypothetical protein WBA22_19255 [Candidatus Methanofastidiosia archaeon]
MRGRKRSLKGYPLCDRCGSSADVVAYGKRVNKHGSKQTYYCRKCVHKFTPDDGFKGRRFPSEVIQATINLTQEGLTLKQVTKHIKNEFGIGVSESTVLDWIDAYGAGKE